MSGFSSIIGLSKKIADTLYEVISAVATHAALNVGAAVHPNAMIRNDVNLLDGLDPTFGNWGTDPGTAANLVNETGNNLTTSGVIATLNTGIITYDLGSVQRIATFLVIYQAATTAVPGIELSLDNATWWVNGSSRGTIADKCVMVVGSARYVRFCVYNPADANITITRINNRVYRI